MPSSFARKAIPWILLLIASWSLAQPIAHDQSGESHSVEYVGKSSAHLQTSPHLGRSNPRSSSPELLAARGLTHIPDPIQDGMISRTHYTKLGSMVPIITAAQTLEVFYQAVAASARNTWWYTPETDIFIVTQGQIELSFRCSRADIPWQFVGAFAQLMAENVAKGWVETYDSVWMNPARTIGIHVALRLKGAVGL